MSAPPLHQPNASAGALPLVVMVVAVSAWGLGRVPVKQISVDGLTVAFYRLWLGSALTVAVMAVARHRPTIREFALSASADPLTGW